METRSRKLAHGLWKLVRLPGIAPGLAPWRGAILLLNHNRIRCDAWQVTSDTRSRIVAPLHATFNLSPATERKGPGAFVPPARAISTKNKHLLAIYSIPARGFTAAVSVFGGTPPPKPLICKSVSNHFGARPRSRWADPTGGKPRLSCAIFGFATVDIIEMSGRYRSQPVHLSLRFFTMGFREIKNPAYTG